MDWRTPTLADAPILQECALNNNFFANNYGAVNSILYEKKFHSQISIEGSLRKEISFPNFNRRGMDFREIL